MRKRPAWIPATALPALAFGLLAAPVSAQSSPPASNSAPERAATVRAVPQPQSLEIIRRRLHGVLAFTNVTLRYDAAPAREAFDTLAARLDVPMIGRWRDDAVGHGLDPEAPITLDASGEPALQVLEEMLGQCGQLIGQPCTWQLRTGFIEYGTKRRLNVPAARELRTYYIADLSIDTNPFAVGKKRERDARRELRALDLVRDVVETIEPGQWDYGQELPEPEPPEAESRLEARTTDGDSRSAALPPDRASTPEATSPPPPTPPRRTAPRRYVTPGRPASIRYWRDFVIVVAPDYVHRQIDGYPAPIPPGAASPSDRSPPASPPDRR